MSKWRSREGGEVNFQNLGKYKRVGQETIVIILTLYLSLDKQWNGNKRKITQ